MAPWDSATRKRVAILVSRYDHCLLDLLWRWRRGELEADVSWSPRTRRTCAATWRPSGSPTTTSRSTPDTKAEAEAQLLELLQGQCDLVVLARYMQILSAEFLERLGCPVINIHHSFLPAFAGAGPYEQAKERGVKLIGATAHYVTEELDAGPIIEQDVVRVTHQHDRRAADAHRAPTSSAACSPARCNGIAKTGSPVMATAPSSFDAALLSLRRRAASGAGNATSPRPGWQRATCEGCS